MVRLEGYESPQSRGHEKGPYHPYQTGKRRVPPEALEGATVYGPGDETIGTVSHVDGLGTNMTVIVDVGGFLGIGGKPVAVKVAALDFMRDENCEVHAVTSWSKDQLKTMPEHHD